MLFFFFFNDTATTEIYTLSLHDALPIFGSEEEGVDSGLDVLVDLDVPVVHRQRHRVRDRKSTRLNSSHGYISYAVFCLKKKNHAHSLFNNAGPALLECRTACAVHASCYC